MVHDPGLKHELDMQAVQPPGPTCSLPGTFMLVNALLCVQAVYSCSNVLFKPKCQLSKSAKYIS
jgi:hypothetical protein